MRLRLAELVAAWSLATDLGLGLPQEHVLRQCRIALGLAERLGLDEADRAAVYYVAMLAWVGFGVRRSRCASTIAPSAAVISSAEVTSKAKT